MSSETALNLARAPAGLSWPLIVGCLAYLGFLAYGKGLLGDPDTYWHVAAGRWILDHGAIPFQDPFSHTMRGAPWMAHEWLSEVILALAHQAGGWAGVVAVTALAFASTLAILTRFLLKNFEPVHVLMFVAFAAMMAAPHLHARPHVLAMPLMVIWTAHLVRASDQGTTPSLWLLPVMALWANLHGGFTLGLALSLAFALEGVLSARKINQTAKAARYWGLFVGFSFISALLTPHGIKGILFTLQILGGSYALDNIGEWQSPNFHSVQPLEIWLLFGLVVALHQGLRFPIIRLVLLLGLLHLALKHSRNIELIGLLTPLFLAAPLARQWRERSAAGRQLAKMDLFFQSLAQPTSRLTAAVTVAGLALITLLVVRLDTLRPEETVTPSAAVQAVRKAHLTGLVLNEYGFGGYLIYSGIAPFIDGRADMYGDDFLKEYIEAVSLKSADGLPKLLQKYRIEWTLMPPESAAVALLDHLQEWRRLYADKVAVVHVKKTALEEAQKP
ncbi:MAG: hypothetical protein K8H75_16130 [Sulfuricella sp.]|nr:hypothetical protein [Sulfuricella sp.]